MSADDTERSEYAHGYDNSLTEYYAARNAAVEASFFLPYLRPNMNLLDCGCGSGSITNGLAEYLVDGHVTGIDIEETELEKARSNANDKALKNVQYETADVYNLPYPDNSFDAVFSHALIQHLDEPMKALGEMKRVLKSNGRIGVRGPDYDGFIVHGPDPDILKKGLDIFFIEDWQRFGGDSFIGRRLRGLLHEAGFSHIQASASYDYHGTTERVKRFGQIAVGIWQNIEWTARLVQNGITDRETIEQNIRGWKDWSEHPDSFYAMAFCEVMGVKE